MNDAKRILILGASGMIGRALYQRLNRHRGWKITGTFYTHPDLEQCFIPLTLGQPGRMEEILEAICPDVIVSALRGDFGKQLEVHRAAAEYLERSGGRMIFLSTANVFDNSTDTAHVESDPTDSGSEYGKYKIACEKMLSEILGENLAILRLPFVWGKNSPRVLQVREGCQKGCLEVYEGLKSNHASDMQIAEYVEWIIEREKSGIFHVGTSELMDYPQFIRKMVERSGWKQPEFQREYTPEVLAVLTEREDIPERLSWTTERLLAYLSDSRLDDEGGEQSVVTKNAELCKTVIGTVKISRYLPYPCDPEPEIAEENGQIRRIVTASHRFRLHDVPAVSSEVPETAADSVQEITPIVYQSCMYPEQIRIYPVELEFTDRGIVFQVRGQQWIISEKDASSVEILDWRAKLEKKSCIPCTNCGKCSW